MSMPAVIPESPVESCPESDVDLYETNQMPNKTTSGSKKWISEFDPPPAASTSPPVTSTADIYDFQERVTEMVIILIFSLEVLKSNVKIITVYDFFFRMFDEKKIKYNQI